MAVAVGLGDDVADLVVGRGPDDVQSARIEGLAYAPVIAIVLKKSRAYAVGVGSIDENLAQRVIGAVVTECGDGPIHIGELDQTVVAIVNVQHRARRKGGRSRARELLFDDLITGAIVSKFRMPAVRLGTHDQPVSAVVLLAGDAVLVGRDGCGRNVVVDRPRGARHKDVLLDAIAGGVKFEGIDKPFRVYYRRQLIGAVKVIMRHAPQGIRKLDAVAHGIVGIAGAVAEGVDVRGLAVIEIVLHAHGPLVREACGGTVQYHITHRIVRVLGA